MSVQFEFSLIYTGSSFELSPGSIGPTSLKKITCPGIRELIQTLYDNTSRNVLTTMKSGRNSYQFGGNSVTAAYSISVGSNNTLEIIDQDGNTIVTLSDNSGKSPTSCSNTDISYQKTTSNGMTTITIQIINA